MEIKGNQMSKEEMLKCRLAALKLADDLYRFVRQPEFRKIGPKERLEMFQKKCPQFARAYPVILAHMVQDFAYSHKAFERYLKKVEVNPGKGMEGFNERQADYAKYLYMALNPKWTAKEAKIIWQETYKQLDMQRKEIEKLHNEMKSQLDQEEKENLDRKRREIIEFAKARAAERAGKAASDPPDLEKIDDSEASD